MSDAERQRLCRQRKREAAKIAVTEPGEAVQLRSAEAAQQIAEIA